MVLLFTLLNLMISADVPIGEELVFELPPNEISIIEVIDYFDD